MDFYYRNNTPENNNWIVEFFPETNIGRSGKTSKLNRPVTGKIFKKVSEEASFRESFSQTRSRTPLSMFSSFQNLQLFICLICVENKEYLLSKKVLVLSFKALF